MQDKRNEKAREERDRRVAACWERFREFDRFKLWGPCGGPRIEWEGGEGEEDVVVTRPLSYLFDLDILSICLTQLSEEGLWDEETLREVYERAAEHNDIIKERDMLDELSKQSHPDDWWLDGAHQDAQYKDDLVEDV